ncbi:MAG: phospho-N-acetylmuramoyl-pentapeptide-transferase [Candidatus Cloacimonetes bacterium]|nr:phospho-N-acetylmuramoyl-pentapeptide-transferase [Candidatus Cloacimonadota bacterium]
MFFHLFSPLAEYHIFFNVFRYITFRSVAAFITALLFSFFIGPKIINLLKKYNAVEKINDLVPDTHKKKEGTPTMGGLIMLSGILLSTILWNNLLNSFIIMLLITILWLGGLGFLDDYLKNVLKKKEGLSAKYKLIGQTVLAIMIACTIYFSPESSEVTIINLPFLKGAFIQLSWLFIPFVVFMIVGTSNAVNLTDGLDGLAAGLIALTTFGLGVMAYLKGNYHWAVYLNLNFIGEAGEITIFTASMIGTTLGFLWFNTRPAEIFMGDTGSLSMGGLLALISIFLQEQFFFAIIAAVFIAEAMSSIIQRYFFKMTRWKYGEGRRFFKRAPLHHHFELKGVPEEKIVIRFWVIGVLLLSIGLATLKLR